MSTPTPYVVVTNYKLRHGCCKGCGAGCVNSVILNAAGECVFCGPREAINELDRAIEYVEGKIHAEARRTRKVKAQFHTKSLRSKPFQNAMKKAKRQKTSQEGVLYGTGNQAAYSFTNQIVLNCNAQ